MNTSLPATLPSFHLNANCGTRAKLSLAGAATSIIFGTTSVVTNTCLFCDKTCLLSQQMFCHDKHIFVIYLRQTNICHDKHNFVTTKVMSWQAYFCCDKHMFLATKHIFCRDTKVCLSQQHFCCDKHVSYLLWQKYFDMTKIRQKFCCDKHTFVMTCFVATNTCLSRQNICRTKNDTCGSSHQWYKTPLFHSIFDKSKTTLFHTNADCVVKAKLEVMLVFDEHISPCNFAFVSFRCWLFDKSRTPPFYSNADCLNRTTILYFLFGVTHLC